jgi:hypothetical protein
MIVVYKAEGLKLFRRVLAVGLLLVLGSACGSSNQADRTNLEGSAKAKATNQVNHASSVVRSSTSTSSSDAQDTTQETSRQVKTQTAAPTMAISFQKDSTLWRVGQDNDELIGKTRTTQGQPVELTDIAQDPKGNLWAISFTNLYKASPTGRLTLVGSLGDVAANAIEFAQDGTLFLGTNKGDLLTVDPATARTKIVGSYGVGHVSSGDLAFYNGKLYATVTSRDNKVDHLAVFNPKTGEKTAMSEQLPNDVFGLFVSENKLFGITHSSSGSCEYGELLEIDPNRGKANRIRCIGFTAGGATSAIPNSLK